MPTRWRHKKNLKEYHLPANALFRHFSQFKTTELYVFIQIILNGIHLAQTIWYILRLISLCVSERVQVGSRPNQTQQTPDPNWLWKEELKMLVTVFDDIRRLQFHLTMCVCNWNSQEIVSGHFKWVPPPSASITAFCHHLVELTMLYWPWAVLHKNRPLYYKHSYMTIINWEEISKSFSIFTHLNDTVI